MQYKLGDFEDALPNDLVPVSSEPAARSDPASATNTIPGDLVPAPIPAAPGLIMSGLKQAASRLPDLMAGAVSAVGVPIDFVADALERRFPLGTIDIGPDWLPFHRPVTQAEMDNPNPLGQLARQGAEAVNKNVIAPQPTYTWEGVKNDWTTAPGFIAEQGIGSVPDMLAAVFAPFSYFGSRTGEIAGNRADADQRAGAATATDLTIAAPAAAVNTVMERMGAHAMVGGLGGAQTLAGAAKRIGRATATEAANEAVDEGGEYLATNAGTKTGATAA